MKYQDNKLYFGNAGPALKLQDGLYKITGSCVTDGQDPKDKVKAGTEIKMDTKDLSFTFEVGRSDSTKVTDWFDKTISANQNTFNRSGKKLNFAFIGDLTLKFNNSRTHTFSDIVIAEGDGRWWFGGKNCKLTDPGRVTCDRFLFSHEDRDSMKTPVYVSEDNSIDFAKWMSQIADDTSLSELSIPGTHDSGTENSGSGPAHTQNFSIERQLNDGIRFLDIRVSNINGPVDENDPLKVKHGVVDCWITFGKVLKWCRNFLKNNPSETICMLMNDANDGLEFGRTVEEGFNIYLDKSENKDLFYLDTNIPTLKAARGKIILFRRFESNQRSSMGIDLQKGWGDNKTFSLTTEFGRQQFYIEDQYNEHNTPKKYDAVESNLKRAKANSSDGIFYMTYNSISAGGHTPYQYAWGGGVGTVDPKMNPALIGFLEKNQGKNRWGVVLLDFYNNEDGKIDNRITEYLINSNF
ncbi:MAG: phosphatidylinositol-specific phospholipase C [Bacteroidales bacterium]|jgi:1-phosphatidylinositol phosphodiesterase|nr:phosphatidylinositol-specific phospholipase C [Bacteroidales bacterium]